MKLILSGGVCVFGGVVRGEAGPISPPLKSRPPVVSHMDTANIASVSNSGSDPAARHRYTISED